MNIRTRIFLVLLQLCIGWHLFYEGVWKIRQGDAWSSRGYIRGATGPFSLLIRGVAGDPEVVWRDGRFWAVDSTPDFLARFQTKPFDSAVSPENRRLYRHAPALIDTEWDAYFERFVKHYELDAPERGEQLARAESKFQQAKADLVDWLLHGVTKVRPPHFSGTADVPVTTPQRVEEYRDKLRKLEELETVEKEFFGPNATAAKRQQLKMETAAIRTALQADLDAKTAQMRRTLYWEVLTPEQRRMDPVRWAPTSQPGWRKLEWLDRVMDPVFQKLGAVWPAWDRLRWVDKIVRWGLTAAGVGLLLGLFTRTACVIAIALLTLFYLAMPPWPGAPESPAGHYLFVNGIVIEVVALFVIAVSDPAARYGLDAWMPFRWWGNRKRVSNGSPSWHSI
jgi:uncharacterized membrane protein YphA (DoxX/SURF4 family)